MRPTIRDVAERAGVSAMAVSVVLNGTTQKISVSKEKAELIRKAAQELNYRPNSLARSLRNNRTGQVAVVFQNFHHFIPESAYRAQVMNGVMDALFPKDFTLCLCPRLIRDGDPDYLNDGRFDGVLWCRPDLSDEATVSLQNTTVPVVLMHAPPGTVLGVPTFCADNEGAMRRVVNHLLSLGHEKIAYVIDPVSETSVEGVVRGEALRAAARSVGMPEPDTLVLDVDHSVLKRYRGADAPHSALVCFSDELATFVLESCEALGVSVPGDISVVGFDSTYLCERTRPRLTSVRQPVEQIAREATSHLISLIEARTLDQELPSSKSTLYDCVLDVRESTGPPKNSLVSP